MRPITLLAVIAVAAPASAAVLTMDNISYSFSSGSAYLSGVAGNERRLAFAGGQLGNYAISAGEVCVLGFCTGGAGPAITPPGVGVRGFSVTCTLIGGPCGDLELSFGANTVALPNADPVYVRLAGSLSGPEIENASYFADVAYSFGNVGDMDTFNIPSGVFNILRNGLTDYDSSAFSVTTSLSLSLAAGQTLNVPDGFTIQFGASKTGPGAVPEPAYFVLVGGAVVILIARKRRKSVGSHTVSSVARGLQIPA